MNIRNINKVVFKNGGTSDIIRVVMMAYDIESDPQIYELAEKLKGSTTVETCRNIWQYLVDTIDYAADSDGDRGEMVRTPARLVHDSTGDCKSYSLFTAVILRYLKIPHVFRFTSYSSRKEATHVYVVAFDGADEVVIDAVAKEQLNTPFGVEKQYTYRCDMANGGTKISYLAGFNSVGKIGKKKRIGAFNSQPLNLSAVQIIDASLERLQAAYDINPSDDNREQLNISKLLVHAATSLNLDSYKVSRALYGIAYLSENNALTGDYESVEKQFDSIDYNQITEKNVDRQLLATLQSIVLEQKKNSVSGLMTDNHREKRIAVKLDWAAALYFLIYCFYTDDEITAKFSNSTELLKKRKYVGIFVKVFWTVQEWTVEKLTNACRKVLEAKFGPITKLKENIESGQFKYENITQVIFENTEELEDLFDIWFYPLMNGIINFNTDMIKNIVPLEQPDIPNNNNSNNNSGNNGGNNSNNDDTSKKSNTGLLLGALSALFLLR